MRNFYRLSGGGNDFLAFVDPVAQPKAGLICEWCRRGVSAGADGVLLLYREQRSVRMAHYNADGGRSKLCLNGCRCAAQLAFFLGWREEELLLETDIGTSRCRKVDPGRIEIELPTRLARPRGVALQLTTGMVTAHFVEVGVPHLVLPQTETLGTAPVLEQGPDLRRHPALGPDGANVNFVRYVRNSHCEIRTFERGVESETLACGTGVVAAVAVGAMLGELSLPATALTAGGYELEVTGAFGEGILLGPTLTGDARIVARGELLAGASGLPKTASWSG